MTTGKNPGCPTQTRNTSALYSLPAGLNVDTLPSLQAIPSSAVSSSGNGLSTGAIVGIAIGCAVGAIAIAVGVYLVLKCGKRRSPRGGPQRIDLGDMDIDGDDAEVRTPIVEPFMSQTSVQLPTGSQRGPRGASFTATSPWSFISGGGRRHEAKAGIAKGANGDMDIGPHPLSHSQLPSDGAQGPVATQTDHRPVYSLYSDPPPSSSQSSRPEKERTYSNLRGSIPFPEPTRYVSRSSESAAGATLSSSEAEAEADARLEVPDRIHRHIDGGLLETSPESRGDVDLPPLYTDINRNAT